VWGGITGEQIVHALAKLAVLPVSDEKVRASEQHLAELLAREGTENPYELRRELRALMDTNVGVFRTGDGLAKALAAVLDLRERSRMAPVADKGRVYNSNLFHALEFENLLDLAEITVAGALARQESRGAHARRDFATRDDERWLRHTLAWHTPRGPRFDHKPVTITMWKPVERKY
jgi:succinate dehydrogenase / fumarate reductase flavoprotein subunit